MSLIDLHTRISQFVTDYGGTPPKADDPKSLDMISDFLLVIRGELDFSIKRLPE